jgi:AcrR family transcriptional regulator
MATSGSRTRRRGTQLEQAIRTAVMGELVDKGLGGLTYESVAERCATGKAALYRRWSTREDMVLDCLRAELLMVADVAPDTGDLRSDVHQVLARMNESMSEPVGRAVTRLISEFRQHPALSTAVRERLIVPRRAFLDEAFRREAARRGLAPSQVDEEVWVCGSSMVVWYHLFGEPLSPQALDRVVDYVVLPVIEAALARAAAQVRI